MNAMHRLTQAIMIGATLAAGFMAQASDGTALVVLLDTVHITGKRLPRAEMALVQLPRVEITGKRMVGEVVVVQLPRVEITGKRNTESTTLLAEKNPRGSVARVIAPV